MAVVGHELKKNFDLPIGIQILAGENVKGLCYAKYSDLDFIRCEGFVFAHTGDEGIMESNAGELLRYRKMIDAEEILIFTDIKKKHSAHALTQDVGLVETAHAAEFFMSDGLIVTGTSTGKAADPIEVAAVKKAVKLPVVIGSGMEIQNLQQFLPNCDAMIVGSHFKKKGNWKNGVEAKRVQRFMDKVGTLL